MHVRVLVLQGRTRTILRRVLLFICLVYALIVGRLSFWNSMRVVLWLCSCEVSVGNMHACWHACCPAVCYSHISAVASPASSTIFLRNAFASHIHCICCANVQLALTWWAIVCDLSWNPKTPGEKINMHTHTHTHTKLKLLCVAPTCVPNVPFGLFLTGGQHHCLHVLTPSSTLVIFDSRQGRRNLPRQVLSCKTA